MRKVKSGIQVKGDKVTLEKVQKPVKVGGKKSKITGYVKDIAPERLDGQDAMAVPPASAKGKQDGVPLPTERAYNAKYEVVDAAEAMRRMQQRESGTMEQIEGGITDPMDDAEFFSAADKAAEVAASANDYDPIGTGGQDPETPTVRVAPTPAEQHNVMMKIAESPADIYLKRRRRIYLELDAGEMSMKVIDVKASKYSVTIVLPSKDESSIFIPKPGSTVTIRTDEDDSYTCYFPGAHCELSDLGVVILSFIKADE